MKKYRIVGELADNGQSITKFKKEIKKQERRNSYERNQNQNLWMV